MRQRRRSVGASQQGGWPEAQAPVIGRVGVAAGQAPDASVGPEHALLHDLGRAEYGSCSDDDAVQAAVMLSRTEGIIPALESAHAVAEAIRIAPHHPGQVFVINLSGRGDKDIDIYRENLKELDNA